ncbi:MAG: type II toxin-antitoxin system VapC family toxin [Rubrobacteraceae bacterium]
MDTAGWGHVVDPTQEHHDLAASIYRRVRQRGDALVTTNYVLTELVALLTSPLRIPRPRIIAFVGSLKASPYVHVTHIDPELDSEAWRLLAERPDKEWSLVDCASFVLMRQREINEALTSDHHFEQAGFSRLLKQ